MENGATSKIVRYYWQMEDGQAFEASKDILWKYMLEHRDEL